MTKQEKVSEAINRILNNTGSFKTRRTSVKGLKVGQMFRQGDIYVARIKTEEGRAMAKDMVQEVSDFQLAPGNTVGSRHALKGQGFKMWRPDSSRTPFQGPIFQVQSGGAVEVDHPVHGTFTDLPEGWYKVMYQIDGVTGLAAQD